MPKGEYSINFFMPAIKYPKIDWQFSQEKWQEQMFWMLHTSFWNKVRRLVFKNFYVTDECIISKPHHLFFLSLTIYDMLACQAVICHSADQSRSYSNTNHYFSSCMSLTLTIQSPNKQQFFHLPHEYNKIKWTIHQLNRSLLFY